ncbi:hypothetical protein GTY73_28330 [Streptomyces sp. SID8354]|nr:hypothetical protein [Streptomyces sp. SID8354]
MTTVFLPANARRCSVPARADSRRCGTR